MRALFTATLVLVTFSVTKCGTNSKVEKLQPAPSTKMEFIDDFDLMATMADCNETFRVEMSYLEALNTSGSFPDETDKTPKCFVRCLLEKSEVVSEDGGFDVQRTAEVFSMVRGGITRDDIADMAQACTDRSESCKCEKSYQYLKCLFETEIKTFET